MVCGDKENLKFDNKALVNLNTQIPKQLYEGNNGRGMYS